MGSGETEGARLENQCPGRQSDSDAASTYANINLRGAGPADDAPAHHLLFFGQVTWSLIVRRDWSVQRSKRNIILNISKPMPLYGVCFSTFFCNCFRFT